MADDKDQVRIEWKGKVGRVPRTRLDAYVADGAKVLDEGESLLTKAGRGGALGAFSGTGIAETQTPIEDTLRGLLNQIGAIGRVASGQTRMSSRDPERDIEAFPLVAIPRGLYGSGREVYSGVEHKDIEEASHGLGSLITQLLLLRGGKEAATTPLSESTVVKGARATKEGVRTVGREVLTGGEKSVAEEVARRRQAATEEMTSKREAAKEKYSEALAEREAKAKGASAKESAMETKRSAVTLKRGPVYQRMTRLADDIQNRVNFADKTIRAKENAKWDQFRQQLKDHPQDASPIADKIADVEERILSTESVPIFKRIMDELAADDPIGQASIFRRTGAVDVKELLRNPQLSEAARSRLMQQLEEIGEGEQSRRVQNVVVPVDYLRRISTKLGERMFASVPSDVYRALKEVQKTAESLIEQNVERNIGKAGVKAYRQLRNDWREYMEAFYDKDSPLRKLKDAQDPDDKMRPITSEEGQRAIDLLSRYRQFAGPAIGLMGRLRAINKEVRAITGKGERAPKTPERPDLGGITREGESELGKVTPEAVRSERFSKAIERFRKFGWDDKTAMIGAFYELVKGAPLTHIAATALYPVLKRLAGAGLGSDAVRRFIVEGPGR